MTTAFANTRALYNVLDASVETARFTVPGAGRPEICEVTVADFLEGGNGVTVRLAHSTGSWGPASVYFFVHASEPDARGAIAVESGLNVNESKLIHQALTAKLTAKPTYQTGWHWTNLDDRGPG